MIYIVFIVKVIDSQPSFHSYHMFLLHLSSLKFNTDMHCHCLLYDCTHMLCAIVYCVGKRSSSPAKQSPSGTPPRHSPKAERGTKPPPATPGQPATSGSISMAELRLPRHSARGISLSVRIFVHTYMCAHIRACIHTYTVRTPCNVHV